MISDIPSFIPFFKKFQQDQNDLFFIARKTYNLSLIATRSRWMRYFQ